MVVLSGGKWRRLIAGAGSYRRKGLGWFAQSRPWGPRAYLLKECFVCSWYFMTVDSFSGRVGIGVWCCGGAAEDMVADLPENMDFREAVGLRKITQRRDGNADAGFVAMDCIRFPNAKF